VLSNKAPATAPNTLVVNLIFIFISPKINCKYIKNRVN
jgi:hypothetical protein